MQVSPVIGFAQLRHIGRDAACGAIEREREYEARYTYMYTHAMIRIYPVMA